MFICISEFLGRYIENGHPSKFIVVSSLLGAKFDIIFNLVQGAFLTRTPWAGCLNFSKSSRRFEESASVEGSLYVVNLLSISGKEIFTRSFGWHKIIMNDINFFK